MERNDDNGKWLVSGNVEVLSEPSQAWIESNQSNQENISPTTQEQRIQNIESIIIDILV
jgi:hypothetical protein